MTASYKIGWFSTARGEGSRQLLTTVITAIRSGELQAGIEFVFCSREPGENPKTDLFLEMVRGYGIPLVCYSYRKFAAEKGAPNTSNELPQWRLDYDREVMRRIRHFRPNMCMLAGYMLIVGKEMCQKYAMINLHPALPGGPTGTWQEVIWKLIAADANETGVMIHLVTPELDRGPVVSYCMFPIHGGPFDAARYELQGRDLDEVKRSAGENNRLFQLIRHEGVKRELPLIVATLKALADGKMIVTPGKVTDARGEVVPGFDLTGQIERAVSGEK